MYSKRVGECGCYEEPAYAPFGDLQAKFKQRISVCLN